MIRTQSQANAAPRPPALSASDSDNASDRDGPGGPPARAGHPANADSDTTSSGRMSSKFSNGGHRAAHRVTHGHVRPPAGPGHESDGTAAAALPE